MSKNIRHRRLHAFYRSKVLNALMIVIIVCLMLMAYTHMMLLPVVCGSLAMACFVGYSLWLWVKKPQSITISNWLSDINGWFTLYFLIVVAMDVANQWWYISPVALAVLILFVSLVRNRDEQFNI